jgi:hypothetical protein
MNYFDLPEVSSSDLGALKRTYYGLPDNREGLEEVFNFGSLVDAMITERHRLDIATYGLRGDDGFYIYYTPADWSHAHEMATGLMADPMIARLIPFCKPQYIFRRTLKFMYEGDEYSIRGRCKFDLIAKALSTGLDFKTTSCKTQKEFVASIDHFDYDKQAAFYMDLGRNDYQWIAAKSKVNGKIFKYAIERGDDTYKRGVQKYSLWSYRWVTLVDPFVDNLKQAA